MFLLVRKLKKKKDIEENFKTTFNTLKFGFVLQRKRNYFED